MDRRVQDAAIALYCDEGWGSFTFDAVAARSGVGKSSLYRRWASKEELLIDALRARTAHITRVDTGSLRGDLVELAVQLLRNYTSPHGLATLRLDVDARAHPALGTRSRQRIEAQITERDQIIENAIARGELDADAPGELVFHTLGGGALHMVISTPIDERAALGPHAERLAEELADFVLGGLHCRRTPSHRQL